MILLNISDVRIHKDNLRISIKKRSGYNGIYFMEMDKTNDDRDHANLKS